LDKSFDFSPDATSFHENLPCAFFKRSLPTRSQNWNTSSSPFLLSDCVTLDSATPPEMPPSYVFAMVWTQTCPRYWPGLTRRRRTSARSSCCCRVVGGAPGSGQTLLTSPEGTGRSRAELRYRTLAVRHNDDAVVVEKTSDPYRRKLFKHAGVVHIGVNDVRRVVVDLTTALRSNGNSEPIMSNGGRAVDWVTSAAPTTSSERFGTDNSEAHGVVCIKTFLFRRRLH
jgi:hypothetical protein